MTPGRIRERPTARRGRPSSRHRADVEKQIEILRTDQSRPSRMVLAVMPLGTPARAPGITGARTHPGVTCRRCNKRNCHPGTLAGAVACRLGIGLRRSGGRAATRRGRWRLPTAHRVVRRRGSTATDARHPVDRRGCTTPRVTSVRETPSPRAPWPPVRRDRLRPDAEPASPPEPARSRVAVPFVLRAPARSRRVGVPAR